MWIRHGVLAHSKKQISKNHLLQDHLWKHAKGTNPIIINDHSMAKSYWYQMNQEGISMKTESRWASTTFIFYVAVLTSIDWNHDSEIEAQTVSMFPMMPCVQLCHFMILKCGTRAKAVCVVKVMRHLFVFILFPLAQQTSDSQQEEGSTKMENPWVFKSLGG